MIFDPSLSTLHMDLTFMSLSCGGFGPCGQNSEGPAKDMATSCSWVEGEQACDSRIVLQDTLTETLLPLNIPYGFKGVKRQRLSTDSVCREDLSSLENDAGLLLGLGLMASGENTGSRASTGRVSVEGMEEESLPMELGVGLIGPAPGGLVKSCMPPVISGPRSGLTTMITDLDIPFNVSRNPVGAVNPPLPLGRLQCSLVGATGKDGVREKVLVSASCISVENSTSTHDLRANSAVLSMSDCVSGKPFGSGHSGAVQDIRSESSYGAEIPVVDEGSTSARTITCGGYISSLLRGAKFDSVTSCEANIGGLGIDLANHVDISDPNLFMNFRALTGKTCTSGASLSLADRSSKTCKFRGCGKGARGASGLCIAHGGGRRCQRQGCGKGAEGRTVYCKSHGGGRRCERLGCTKSAEGKTDYCIGHGGGRRCSQDGCSKAARGKSGLCIRHGGGKRCQKEGCTKSAEGYSGLCISHGGGRRCQFPDCRKGAQGSTMLCKAHGGGKRCMIQGCNKGAEGSTPLCKGHGGGKRCMFEGGGICTKSVHGATSYCVAHGGGKRCAVQGCTKSARGRTDFCVRHGGGKRCKTEHCTKSAQGRTDFCKAHGGGKRCSWGQDDSMYPRELLQDLAGDLLQGPCERFARGKIGLCAAHSALVQDRRVHGASTLGNTLSPGIGPGLFCGLVSGSGSEHKVTKSLSISDVVRIGDSGDNSSECERSDSLMQVCLNYGATGGESTNREDTNHEQAAAKCSIWKTKSTKSPAFNRCSRNNLEMGNELQLAVDVLTGDPHLPNFLVMHGACETSETRKKIPDANSMSHQPLIPPQVLVPLSMQKGKSPVSVTEGYSGHTGCPNATDNGLFSMSSLSPPEERVHGGKIMTVK